MFTIEKEFGFSASHKLIGLPSDHQCSRLHGHNYAVILTLKSETLNDVGFVRDYRELDAVKEWLNSTFDHRHLNDCVSFNPTAENLAKFIFEQYRTFLPELISVTVKETEKTRATYEPELKKNI